jgi:hypothetical protein
MPGSIAELRRHPDDDAIGGAAMMNMVLAGLGMLACIAIMAAVMPLAMRLGRRLTRSSTTPTPAPGGTTSTPQPPDVPAPRPPQQEPS